MPLLVSHTPPPDPPEPPTPPTTRPAVGATWTAPDGQTLNLMDDFANPGVSISSEGVAGLGAAPRSITRQQLATGGALPRWSRSDERIITLPLIVQAPTPAEFTPYRRHVTSLFLQTTPAAGQPNHGTLRITRTDGTWRQIEGIYLSGLEWEDADRQGVVYDLPVLQLLCAPWWTSDAVQELEFRTEASRNYLDPYETVSSGRALGNTTVDVIGDVAAAPVWEITGPATNVTARYADFRAGWTFGAIDAGETITIDVENLTVTDNAGTNRIADLDWSTSRLYQLAPGPNELLLSLTGGNEETSAIRLTYRPRWDTA